MHRYLDLEQIRFNTKYAAFTRNDYPNWKRWQLVLGAMFIFPIRLFLLVAIIFSGSTMINILAFCFGAASISATEPALYRKITFYVVKFHSKMFVLVLGLITRKRRITLDKDKYPKLSFGSRDEEAPISISNHVTWIDILYFMSAHTPGFMSKSSINKVPMIRTYAQFLQSIFVERESERNRESAIESLQERISRFARGE